MKIIIAICIFAFSSVLSLLSAQRAIHFTNEKTGWHNIGEMPVDLSKSQDQLTTSLDEQLSEIKFRVMHGAIYLNRLEVYFDNGDKEEMNVNVPILDLHESADINLRNHDRRLQKIVFHYKALPNNTFAKAYIEVWGIKRQEG